MIFNQTSGFINGFLNFVTNTKWYLQFQATCLPLKIINFLFPHQENGVIYEVEVDLRRNFRFYPTPKQEKEFSKLFGCIRLVYNSALSWRKESYEKGEKPNYSKSSSWLTDLKRIDDYSFLRDVSCVPLQQSLRHLQTAYTNFFRGQAEFPTFKKRSNQQSCEFTSRAFTFRDGELSLAKIGKLKVRWSKGLQSKPSTVTVIKNASGQYFVSLTLKESVKQFPKNDSSIGIDLGIETFATLSDGRKFKQPSQIRKRRKILAHRQRQLSQKKKGSRNWVKARIKVAKEHQKISNIRKDFLHKLSTKLVRENQTISMETLDVSKMLQDNSKELSRLIGEQGWHEFKRMIEYKCLWRNREFRLSGQFFASTQTCSECGRKTKHKLETRNWTCKCGAEHDRDINAAVNIHREALPKVKQSVSFMKRTSGRTDRVSLKRKL